MNAATYQEIESLPGMTVGQLRSKYVDLFREESLSFNKDFLRKKIAWRIQELAEGGLSERARRRALEIANDADLRVLMPRGGDRVDAPGSNLRALKTTLSPGRDPRIPMPGTLLTREFRGKRIVVRVLGSGFEYDGQVFRSLSAVAQKATGTKWNGLAFFGIEGNGVRS